MFLEKLFLENYKIFLKREFLFNKGLNFIVGSNSSGKTTILESIYLLFTGELASNPINYHYNHSRLILNFNFNNVNNELKLLLKRKEERIEKQFYLNDKKLEAIKELRSAFISPLSLNAIDISTLYQGSQNKKDFIDRFLKITDQEFSSVYYEQKKILKQKSNLLKKKIFEDVLDTFNSKIAEYSALISLKRITLLNQIKNNLSEFIRKTWNIQEIKINYKLGTNHYLGDVEEFLKSHLQYALKYIKEKYQISLEDNKKREIENQKNIINSNKDNFDFLVLIENRYYPIGSVLSQSQINIFVLVVFLNLVKKIKQLFGYYPVLLLDEPFVFLDDNNTNKSIRILNNYPQSLITLNKDINYSCYKIYL
ncbi:MAG: AAA family ATPase [bacterium]